ncbi:hypothetical protein C5E45_07040 [Nocardia nova]|uniref:Uncharacterized protein n=1 Tax=Nocardia nova TaxID=37330 RepID=A0A2S6ATZ7_9NOCA|nr:hypothetical protein C5E41_19915 [Nocardia nova]PPJ38658.1 hypothetical protein C5E45_07040 [Nocardia nova]
MAIGDVDADTLAATAAELTAVTGADVIAIALLTAIAEGLRKRFGRLRGSHDTVSSADMSQRAIYLERAGRG